MKPLSRSESSRFPEQLRRSVARVSSSTTARSCALCTDSGCALGASADGDDAEAIFTNLAWIDGGTTWTAIECLGAVRTRQRWTKDG